MYDSDDLSNSNKDNNSNLEDDHEKAEEQQQELRQQQEQHWTYKLFIEYPELFLPFLERGKEKALREVEGLCKIFDEYEMQKDSNFGFILWYRQALHSFG